MPRLLVLLPLLAGCKALEPAPEDLDGLAHYFWQHMDDDARALERAVDNLHGVLDEQVAGGELRGSLTPLTAGELELVGSEGDPSALSGVYLADRIPCSTSSLEALAVAAEQDELHPGTYTAYERDYEGDPEAYLSGETDELAWVTSYSVEGFGASYSARIRGEVRRLGEPGSPFLLRAVLEEAACFDDDCERGLFQDDQLEVYAPLEGGASLHFYAVWREMIYLVGMDFSDPAVQDFVLDGMLDWDEDAAALCSG